MNHLKGGGDETCPCLYAGDQCSSGDDYWGGSSYADNRRANGGGEVCGCVCVGGGSNTNASSTYSSNN